MKYFFKTKSQLNENLMCQHIFDIGKHSVFTNFSRLPSFRWMFSVKFKTIERDLLLIGNLRSKDTRLAGSKFNSWYVWQPVGRRHPSLIPNVHEHFMVIITYPRWEIIVLRIKSQRGLKLSLSIVDFKIIA